MKTIYSYLAKYTRHLKYKSKGTKYPQEVLQTKIHGRKSAFIIQKTILKFEF
jgi:hypothetical protein